MTHRSEKGPAVAPAKRVTPKDTAGRKARHLLGRAGATGEQQQ